MESARSGAGGFGFMVDPDQVSSASQVIAGCARDLGQTVDNLAATLTTGSPWGDDATGSPFGMLYTAVVNHALEIYGSRVELLHTAAENLTSLATSTEQADQTAIQLLNSSSTTWDG